ncbi:MAG TPA: GNAT family N-acetyltransferase, partial [Anaerolineae bacterium]|nr:GNAT family N-acetyltransferase [Anaerolineae bacterium]
MDGEITIRALTSLEEMERVEELQRIIWPGSEVDIVPVHLIKTIARNGGIVLGAVDG